MENESIKQELDYIIDFYKIYKKYSTVQIASSYENKISNFAEGLNNENLNEVN
jgi:hypothetical protein